MKTKIENLLDEKRRLRTILMKEWVDEPYLTATEQGDYACKCDKLEIEIDLLKQLLKD